MSYNIDFLIAATNIYVFTVETDDGLAGASREGVRNVMDKVGVYETDMDKVTERMDAVFNMTSSEPLAAMSGVVLIRNYLTDPVIEDDDWS